MDSPQIPDDTTIARMQDTLSAMGRQAGQTMQDTLQADTTDTATTTATGKHHRYSKGHAGRAEYAIQAVRMQSAWTREADKLDIIDRAVISALTTRADIDRYAEQRIKTGLKRLGILCLATLDKMLRSKVASSRASAVATVLQYGLGRPDQQAGAQAVIQPIQIVVRGDHASVSINGGQASGQPVTIDGQAQDCTQPAQAIPDTGTGSMDVTACQLQASPAIATSAGIADRLQAVTPQAGKGRAGNPSNPIPEVLP